MEFYAETGGFKELHNQDQNQLKNTTFLGVGESRRIWVLFDHERPYHCSDKLATCKDVDDGSAPVFVYEDITTVSLLSFVSKTLH